MMISNAFRLLKRNPVLIFLFLLYMLILDTAAFFLMPHRMDQTDTLALLITTAALMLFSLISGVTGLVFFSGYGHMLAEAVTKGTTSLRSFPAGIARFFSRLFLAFLLLIAIAIGFSIVIVTALIPVSLLMTMGGLAGASAAGIVTTSVVSGLVILSIPFIMPWIPALFIDGAGVIDSLKAGLRAGARNYGALLLWTVILYAPSLIYTLFNLSSMNQGELFTPGYFAVTLLTSVLSLIFTPALFELYNKKRRPAPLPDPGDPGAGRP